MSLDLKNLRSKSRLSQSEVARRIGATQSQVSRWEDNPDDMPYSSLRKYLAAVGVSQVLLTNDLAVAPPLDVGDPYVDLRQRINLLLAYLDHASFDVRDDIDRQFTPKSFRNEVLRMNRKPTITLTGRFDSGKSRLANTLLGQNILPERYTPHTFVPIFVRHICDRPEWVPDTVMILDEEFDFDRWDDEEHVRAHKITDGNYQTLHVWGVRPEEKSLKGRAIAIRRKSGEAHAGQECVALVFAESPLLKACNLIDTPGFSSDERDLRVADSAARGSEILIYTSMAKGFIDGTDVARLPGLIRSLQAPEFVDPAFPTLGNFLVVATHADPFIKDDDLSDILRKGASRLYKELKETVFEERSRLTGRDINEDVLLARFASFWAESIERRSTLERILAGQLRDDFPHMFKRGVSFKIENFKSSSRPYFNERINAYQTTIENLDQARANLNAIKDNEPEFHARMASKREEIRSFMRDAESRNRQAARDVYQRHVNEKAVVEFIRGNYPEKKDAKEYAVSKLAERVNSGISTILENSGRQLSAKITEYLGEYRNTAAPIKGEGISGNLDIPFNAEGAFAGGLVGLAGVGALAVWAASLGNLGAYILVAKGVSVLAAMGISISGGAAAASAAVAAIGGPITIAIGLGTLLALGVWALFGPSWETRLARKIVETFEGKKVAAQFDTVVQQYWEQTRESFEKGCDNLAKEFGSHKARLEDLLVDEALTVEKAYAAIESFRRVREFFENIPWKGDM